MAEKQIQLNKNLFNSIFPLIKLSKFLALFPVKHNQIKDNLLLSWSNQTYFLNIGVGLITTCWAIHGFVTDMIEASFLTLGFRGTIDFFIASFDFSEVVFAGFYFITSFIFKIKFIFKIIKNLHQIDQILHFKVIANMSHCLVFFSVFMLVLYVLDLFMWGNNSWKGLNNYCAFYILYSVVICHEIQYCHLVNLLRIRAKHFNQVLDKNETITDLTIVYQLLTDCVDNINLCFSFSTTIIISSCYIHLALNPYMLFVIATSNESNIFRFVYFLWIFVHIFRLVAIMEVCERCSNEIGKSGKIIFRLFQQKMDLRTKRNIKIFVWKMLKSKVRFSAFALKKIDRSLIFGVIGSISTYWMILLQYSSRTIEL